MPLWPGRLSPAVIAGAALRNRRLMRAPLWLYEHGLGRLLGERLVMVEHLGRASGRTRKVFLEVITRPTQDSLVVASGFGAAAQWYQNLRAHPECHITVGAHRHAAIAEMVAPMEARAALADYQQAHPHAWAQLRGVLEETLGAPVDDLPMVRFRLAGDRYRPASRP